MTKKKPSTKNQMRSIQRLLKREGLPEKARAEKARQLEALDAIAEENKRAERERKLSVRYHKVKFFERVKLTRAMEKLERDNPAATRSDAVAEELKQLKEDLHYVMHFPKGYKYVSVLKNKDETPEAAEYLEKKRRRLRQIIKENMVKDAALAEANEGGEGVASAAAELEAGGGGAAAEKDDFFLEDDDDDDDEGEEVVVEKKKPKPTTG